MRGYDSADGHFKQFNNVPIKNMLSTNYPTNPSSLLQAYNSP